MFLIHLWPWNKVRVIKSSMICRLQEKVVIMHSLKDLALKMSEKKPTLNGLFKQEEQTLS